MEKFKSHEKGKITVYIGNLWIIRTVPQIYGKPSQGINQKRTIK